MAKIILGVFSDRSNAEHAIEEFETRGFDPKDLSIIMRDREIARSIADSTGAHITDSTVSGATTGGVLGGLAGLLVGIGAITIPGIGAILIGGPIAAALGLTGAAATTVSAAVTGALAGGLVGALVGIGVPEDEARIYEESIRSGGILVLVPVRSGEEERVRAVFESHNAEQVRTISQNSRAGREEFDLGFTRP